MIKKLKEWFSVQQVKKPGRIVLGTILLFNIALFLISAAVISALSLDGTEQMNFIESMFCTITMILDAGCIQFVIADIGQSGVIITIVCLLVVLLGMISFTGAVIGYVTNYISHYIENANTGKKQLHISNHYVLLNWNTRASEIVNDLLYCQEKQKVVILVKDRKAEVEKEIEERLNDTVAQENRVIANRYAHLPFFARAITIRKNKFHNKLTVVVRDGDVFSLKQLNDISLDKALAVIILENEISHTVCQLAHNERLENAGRGNSQTLKTLIQVADITAAESSLDNQKIIVEVTDPWTRNLVAKIIKAKQVDGKCNIIPVKINEVLGQILSQFCLMPELNTVYSELFSNKGVQFFSQEHPQQDEKEFISNYFSNHNNALPVTVMQQADKSYAFYVANNIKDIKKKCSVLDSNYSVELQKDYWLEKRNVIILGHNSKSQNIMAGFESFSGEWKRDDEIVNITVIDDKANLEKMNYYKNYPFVTETVEADVYQREIICDTINDFISKTTGDMSILILSDDMVSSADIDASALANLVYVRDIINDKLEKDANFDINRINVIVEIIDPKHHDIVNSYNINNVVISNRYISKMVTQISEAESLFNFYNDILSYDEEGVDAYTSKEVYIKKVHRYFDTVPQPTTADEFVRAVYNCSIDTSKFKTPNPTIVLGYIKHTGEVVLFCDDLTQIKVDLCEKDKVILFAAH